MTMTMIMIMAMMNDDRGLVCDRGERAIPYGVERVSECNKDMSVSVTTVAEKFALVPRVVDEVQQAHIGDHKRFYFYGGRWTGKCRIGKRIESETHSFCEVVYLDEPEIESIPMNKHVIVVSEFEPSVNPKVPMGFNFDLVIHFVGEAPEFELEDVVIVFM